MSRALTQLFAGRALAAGVFATLLLSGCGSQYRPVVTSTNPVGPAAQPQKYAVAISSPSATALGLLTFVDVSGDTVISTPQIQANPNYIALTAGGSQGFTINSAGTLDIFGASNPAVLITSNILQTNLQAGATPISITPKSISGSSASLFIPQPGLNSIAALNTGGQLLQQVSVGSNPTYVVATDGATRAYALNSGVGGTGNTVSSFESSTSAGLSVSSTITVGTNPVYGVMTSDGKRAFILNKGSQNISVINVVNNALDTGIPAKGASGTTAANTVGNISIPSYSVGGVNLASNPVWADFSPLTNELVVLSAGDGTHQGLLTVINIPLCSAAAQPSNPACNSTNPVDGVGFGNVVLQTPVGVNPTMVSVMQDPVTPRAYVANSGSSTTNGSVSVVNVLSGVEVARLTAVADNANNLFQTQLFGLHPTTIASEYSYPKGKVYVTSPDSTYLSIIYTDTDSVYTHVPLYGSGTKVVLTSQ